MHTPGKVFGGMPAAVEEGAGPHTSARRNACLAEQEVLAIEQGSAALHPVEGRGTVRAGHRGTANVPGRNKGSGGLKPTAGDKIWSDFKEK